MGIEEQEEIQSLELEEVEDVAAEEEAVEQEPDDEQEEQEEEVVVTIGDEPPPPAEDKAAPKWVRDLRKSHREAQQRIRELEEQVRRSVPEVKETPVGPKPTLEGCDYDPEKFEEQLTAWHARKHQADKAEREQKEQEEAQQKAWQQRLESYSTARAGLKVRDYEDAESVVQTSLNVTQQGIIIQGADNPALVVYALGKNPLKAKEFADINDPVKFAFAIAKLETQLKIQNRKAPPAPERVVNGAAKISGSIDSNLERLRAEAERTGDYSKVTAYKKHQKEKQRAKV